MPVMNMFPGGSTLQIPLDAPTALAAKAGNAKVELTWTDPKDKYATPEGEQAQDPQQLVSVWAYTKIVRKAGSAPTGPYDGVAVVSSQVRNAYQAQPFVDTGVVNDTTYYYAAFAYNEDFVVSEGDFTSAMPRGIDPVLENNTWGEINEFALAGLAESVWSIGDEKKFTATLKDSFNNPIEREITAIILGFNIMDVVGGGKAPVTFGTKEACDAAGAYAGHAFSWWSQLQVGSFIINGELFNTLSSDLKNVIPKVVATEEKVNTPYNTNQYNWSSQQYESEMFGFTIQEVGGTGLVYQDYKYPGYGYSPFPYYSSNSNRTKNDFNGTAQNWELASVRQNFAGGGGSTWEETHGFYVTANGASINAQMMTSYVSFGFCVGKAAA